MDTCNYCGKEIKNGSIFCSFCGNNIIPWTLTEGTLLHHGRYKITGHIGSGGMANVYLAEDLNLGNTKCVIKGMIDDFKDPQERDYAVTKFKEEAILLARLRHLNLPVVQNHFLEEGKYYLVMDYLEGKNLNDILYDRLDVDDIISEEEVIDWAIQVCQILDYLHNYEPVVIHRDIKLENLIKTKTGRIMLLDFGIAHIFEKRDTKTRIGTSGYAAPEQYMGNACPQSDIFALGAVMHRLLTFDDPSDRKGGPFNFPPINNFRDDISSELSDIIFKALKINLEERYKSAKELMEALVKLRDSKDNIVFDGSSSHLTGKKTTARLPFTEIKTLFLSDYFRLNIDSLPDLKQHFSETAGLDIGSYEVKLLQIDINKKGYVYPRLVSARKTPLNSISSGIITDPEALSNTLRSIMKNRKELKVMASISSYACIIKTFHSLEENKILDTLSALYPSFYDEYYVNYKSEDNNTVRVIMVKKSAYDNLVKTLLMSEITNYEIIIEPFAASLITELLLKNKDKERNMGLVNIGAEGTSIAVISNGVISYSLSFPYGGNEFTHSIMNMGGMEFEDAEEFKKDKENNMEVLLNDYNIWCDKYFTFLNDMGLKQSDISYLVFSGGAVKSDHFYEYVSKKLNVETDRFILPGNRNILQEKHKKLIYDKQFVMMCSSGLILSTIKDIRENRRLFSGFDVFYSPSEIKPQDKPAITYKELIEGFEKYLISIVGPVGQKVFNESIIKLGHEKDNIPPDALDGVIEMFCCQFNISHEDIEKISKKIQEIKSAFEKIRNNTPVEYKNEIDIINDLENYLISITGQAGKKVFADVLMKQGYERENYNLNNMDSLVEMFCCQFKLSEADVENITKKLRELKTAAEPIIKRAEEEAKYKNEIDLVIDFQKYLISIVGPVGEKIFDECAEKLGCEKDNMSLNIMDSLLEMFCCQFKLSEADIKNITSRLYDLRAIWERIKSKSLRKEKKKSFLSSLFSWK